MKNKFDIVYESIVDEILNKAEVTYQTNDEFKKEVSEKLQSLKDENNFDDIESYLQEVYDKNVKKEANFLKDDRLKVLTDTCHEILGVDLVDVLHNTVFWTDKKNEIKKENEKKLS